MHFGNTRTNMPELVYLYKSENGSDLILCKNPVLIFLGYSRIIRGCKDKDVLPKFGRTSF